jgi:uncharacterized protein (TIGR00369 family)
LILHEDHPDESVRNHDVSILSNRKCKEEPAMTADATEGRGAGGKRSDADERLNDRSAYQACFGCGMRNDTGLQLVFRQEGEEIVTEFIADARFQGFPGVVHGGILATLLDETLSRTATAEGRWMMTGRLEVRYRQAAPLGRPLRVTARTVSSRSRMVAAEGAIRLADEPETIIAEAQGTFLPIPRQFRQKAVERHPELAGFFDI